ncbi:MAG: helix-turn-helix domain-containing protein [Flavisolibacter sp.]
MQETKTIHEGRNVKRIREILGIKQEALALDLGISQQAISALEQKEALDKDMLEKVANALKVSPEVIKNYTDDRIVFQIQNMNDNSQAIYHYNFNPLEKYVEQVEENKRLYEELLKSEREKVQLLERIINKC